MARWATTHDCRTGNKPPASNHAGGAALNQAKLIGRTPIAMDLRSVRERIEGLSVLVTGAAGFIGSLLAEALIDLGPAKLVLLDRSEQDLHRLSLQLSGRLGKPHCQVELVLGDLLNTGASGRAP